MVEVRLLGPPSIRVDGVSTMGLRRRTVAVLALVLLADRPVARASLATMLWPDTSDRSARGNLRVALSELRGFVGDAVTADRQSITWVGSERVSVDVVEVLDAVARLLGDRDADGGGDRNGDVAAVAASVIDELLPGFESLAGETFAGWLELQRSILQSRRVTALDRVVDDLLALGDADRAVEVAGWLVTMEPYRVASHRRLVTALVEAGEPQRAARHVESLDGRVDPPLGPEDVQELRAALARSARSDRSRRGETDAPGPPPATVAAVRADAVDRLVPLPPESSLVGRETLLDELVGLHRASGQAVVTLVGPGGVGKTSLATAVAHRWRRAGHDVAFVDLTVTGRGESVASLVASALGVVSGFEEDRAVDAVVGVLGERDVRLVVDNLEHVLSAVSMLRDLSRRAAGLTLLVTSRTPMRSSEETVVEVPPLSWEPTADGADPPAVQLFRTRAAAAGAHGPGDPEAMGRLCALLDGLPLAIELAAARRRVMTAHEIADAIEDGIASARLDVLSDGPVDVPERHRALAATIASSMDLLDADARALLERCSVFEGPFTLDHAHDVGAPDRDRIEVLRGLQRAVEFHLLRRVEADGAVWMSMLPTVRAAVRALLAEQGPDTASDVLDRRVRHDVGLVVRASEAMATADDRRWVFHLDRYWPSVAHTLDALHDRRDRDEAAVVTALGPFWTERARFAEGLRVTERCTVHPDARAASPWLPGELRMWTCALRAETEGYARSEAAVDELCSALDQVVDADPPIRTELRLIGLAQHVTDLAGRAETAASLARRGIRRAEATGELRFAAEFRYAEAMLAHVAGDDERAASGFLRALADAEVHDHTRIAAYARMMLQLAGIDGPPGGTEMSLRELLDVAISIGDRRQVVWLTVSLGAVTLFDGDLPAAASYYLDSVRLSRDADYFLGMGFSLMGGASIAAARGDLAEANVYHGAVADHLGFLTRGMPRAYVEPYVALVELLDAASVDDPTLLEDRSWGSAQPVGAVLTRLSRYLAGVSAAR